MGKTTRFDDDEKRNNKSVKHAKNQRGYGMRVINRWSEEEVDTSYDDNLDNEQYPVNTSQYIAKRK
jgi:hypothetical protein